MGSKGLLLFTFLCIDSNFIREKVLIWQTAWARDKDGSSLRARELRGSLENWSDEVYRHRGRGSGSSA